MIASVVSFYNIEQSGFISFHLVLSCGKFLHDSGLRSYIIHLLFKKCLHSDLKTAKTLSSYLIVFIKFFLIEAARIYLWLISVTTVLQHVPHLLQGILKVKEMVGEKENPHHFKPNHTQLRGENDYFENTPRLVTPVSFEYSQLTNLKVKSLTSSLTTPVVASRTT